MLAKLSALALFLIHVAALGITVPDAGIAGDFVPVDFNISEGDPTNVNLLLFGTNSHTNYTVSENMKVTPQNVVIIPVAVNPGVYQFVATKVGDNHVEYARSNNIAIT